MDKAYTCTCIALTIHHFPLIDHHLRPAHLQKTAVRLRLPKTRFVTGLGLVQRFRFIAGLGFVMGFGFRMEGS